MVIALIATIASPSVHGVIFILVAMVIGGAIPQPAQAFVSFRLSVLIAHQSHHR
jgi:NAD/NADP transhydrogenase beta subunit